MLQIIAEWQALQELISDIQLFLAHSDEQIIRFQIITLLLTMIVCAIIAALMAYIRPRYSLDWSLLVREIAFTAVLARSFIAYYFRNPPQVWSILIYVVLFFSCIWIIVALIKERRMTATEIVAKHREIEGRGTELEEEVPVDIEAF